MKAISINQNTTALYAQQYLIKSSEKVANCAKRLSSGEQFASANEDNIALLSLGENLERNYRDMDACSQNLMQMVNLYKCTGSVGGRIYELCKDIKSILIQGCSDIIPGNVRDSLQEVIEENHKGIDFMVESCKFGNKVLLDGTYSGASTLSTRKLDDKRIFNMTSANDFTSSGRVYSSSSLLQVNSQATVTEDVGESSAEFEVYFTQNTITNNGGNFASGDEIAIEGIEFVAVQNLSTAQRSDSKIEFEMGSTGQASLDSFYKVANRHLVESTVKVVSKDSDPSAASVVNIHGLKFTANQSGCVGNEKQVSINLSGSGGSVFTQMNVNDEGYVDNSAVISRSFVDGTDKRSGKRATMIVEIEKSSQGNTDIEAGQVVKIGNKKYEFIDTTSATAIYQTADDGNIAVDITTPTGGAALSDSDKIRELCTQHNLQSGIDLKMYMEDDVANDKLIVTMKAMDAGSEVNETIVNFNDKMVATASMDIDFSSVSSVASYSAGDVITLADDTIEFYNKNVELDISGSSITNFASGNAIKLFDMEFAAVAGSSGAKQFTVGSNAKETWKNLAESFNRESEMVKMSVIGASGSEKVRFDLKEQNGTAGTNNFDQFEALRSSFIDSTTGAWDTTNTTNGFNSIAATSTGAGLNLVATNDANFDGVDIDKILKGNATMTAGVTLDFAGHDIVVGQNIGLKDIDGNFYDVGIGGVAGTAAGGTTAYATNAAAGAGAVATELGLIAGAINGDAALGAIYHAVVGSGANNNELTIYTKDNTANTAGTGTNANTTYATAAAVDAGDMLTKWLSNDTGVTAGQASLETQLDGTALDFGLNTAVGATNAANIGVAAADIDDGGLSAYNGDHDVGVVTYNDSVAIGAGGQLASLAVAGATPPVGSYNAHAGRQYDVSYNTANDTLTLTDQDGSYADSAKRFNEMTSDKAFNFGSVRSGVDYQTASISTTGAMHIKNGTAATANGFTNDNSSIKLADVAKDSNSNKISGCKLGTDDSNVTFTQGYLGTFGDSSLTFLPGDTTSTGFKHNKLKMSVTIGDTLFNSAEDIILCDIDRATESGFRGKGRKIKPGLEVTLVPVGALPTAGGVKLTFDADGYLFGDHTTEDDMQNECSQLARQISEAINGNLNIGTTATVSTEADFGLNSVDNYTVAGVIASGHHIQQVDVVSAVGKTSASSTLQFAAASTAAGFTTSDYLAVNGTKLYADVDFVATSASNMESVYRNIAKAINTSDNYNLSRVSATVVQESGDFLLRLNSRELGVGGNDYSLGASFGTNTVKLNDVGTFGSNPNAVSFGENSSSVNKNVTRGENRRESNYYSPDLIGEVRIADIIFNEGAIDDNDVHKFTANTCQFKLKINGVNYVSDKVECSGGNRQSGNVDGKGYNGMGHLIPGGTQITCVEEGFVPGSSKVGPGIRIALDNQGIVFPTPTNDTSISKRDIDNFIAHTIQVMNDGLSLGSNTRIQQGRTTVIDDSNHDSTRHTVLNGIKTSAATFVTDQYGSDGVIGKFSGFDFNLETKSLFVKIDNKTYSQDLTELGRFYDSSNERIICKAGTQLTLAVAKGKGADDEDAKLLIDLAGVVNDIDVKSDEQAKLFTEALDKFFGTKSSGGISVQINTGYADQVSVTLQNFTTAAIFNGQLSVESAERAKESLIYIDNAVQILDLNRSVLRSTEAQLGLFKANLANLSQTLQESASNFLNCDIAVEIILKAQLELKTKMASTIAGQAVKSCQEQVDNMLRAVG